MHHQTKIFHKVSGIHLIHAIKVTIAALAAIIAANLLDLDYAGSCAVIALITVAATRKETFLLSLKRLLTFFITIMLSFLLYQLIGINYATFGLLMFLMALISYGLGMYGTISVNAVIATHILSEPSLNAGFILNETLLVLIGTLIAILLNLYMPNETGKIRQAISEIESQERQLLKQFQSCLSGHIKSESLTSLIQQLKTKISYTKESARRNEENILSAHSTYYSQYLNMRSEQLRRLEQMAISWKSITRFPKQAETMALLLQHIAETFHEHNNARDLIVVSEAIENDFKHDNLPVDREEFENRAILYYSLLQIKSFLEIKKDFVDSLTEQQIQIYWNKHHTKNNKSTPI